MTEPTRYRLERCGIVNVWQYDRQVFELAEGRLLLRGANGAGKSKTMEMLLPFAIDGDKARLTASGRHHTSLLWLMLDGYDGQARTGYVWVEFTRAVENGPPETLTFGVGIRATQSARAATAWYFTSSRRVGADLVLEDQVGPLSRQQLEAALEEDPAGQVFEQAARYREHVGRLLFGLPGDQYDDLLRLIYWLRQPQVGEDIDPKRLAEQLVNALPQLDDDALRSAGSTFDELEAYGAQIEGRARAAEALGRFAEVYRGYASAVLAEHARAVLDAEARLRSATTEQRRVEAELSSVRDSLTEVTRQESAAQADAEAVAHTIRALESGPEARARATLLEMGERVKVLQARADDAAGHRDRAGERADGRAAQAQQDAGILGQHLTTLDDAVDDVARRLVDGGVGAPTGALEALAVLRNPDLRLRWDSAEPGQGLAHALRATADWLTGADGAAVRRQAAVGVVLEALTAVTEARRTADVQGAREGEAQVRADEARQRWGEARDALAQEEEAFRDAVSRWWRERLDAEPPALDLDGVGALGSLAQDAVDDEAQQLTDEVGRAGAERDTARTLAADLERRRDEVAGQVDQHPEAPRWSRDPRSSRPGAPFWQLVDFADDLGATRRAGLEAALEGAGVLDAWVFPDGHVDSDLLDVQLGHASSSASAVSAAGRMPERLGTLSAPTLSAVLRPDLGDGSSGVGEDVVRGLLDRIGILPPEHSDEALEAVDPSRPPVDAADAADAPGILDRADAAGILVSADGRWRVGPLHGRTTKEVAQFIGAAARDAERQRRLAELDAGIAEARQRGASAEAARRAAQAGLDGIRSWLASRPSHDALLRASSTAQERGSALSLAEADLSQAGAAARAARAEAAQRQRRLDEIAATHELPTTEQALRAQSARLDTARSDIVQRLRDVTSVTADLERWERTVVEARAALAEHADLTVAADRADAEFAAVRNEHALLLQAEGDGVRELEARLAELRAREAEQATLRRQLGVRHDELIGREGALREMGRNAQTAVETARPALDGAREALARLDDVPGFPESLVGADHRDDPDEHEGAQESPSRLSGRSVAELKALIAHTGAAGDHERTRNAVLQAFTALQSSAAAGYEPRHLEQGGVLVAFARDGGADLPVVPLYARLAAAVARDRELLTARERKLFEDHVLGQLGEALRSVRRKSEDLVDAMNEQLRDVTTSQGIRVRLRWRLRDELPAEARRAVELLRQPLGSLLPDEKDELRDSLHRLIDVSRAEAPGEPYAVHLARALDYRQWNAFTVQYHRPETGEWRDLQRRTALSQGEQKVLCYLPLFAAAAAHFTSVAGAAPYAPRFVLLDDAFPKIDIRTHPLLFGLLVQLDLDFVITSERLWGTHSTVPGLAIYEALRSPGERGIAQYQHRWDGHRLAAVGA